MKIKQFADWRKILLAVILILTISSIRNLFITGADIGNNYGFPFNFYGYGGGPPLESGQPLPGYYFDGLLLLGDIVVWYIISFLIVFVYDRIRRKK